MASSADEDPASPCRIDSAAIGQFAATPKTPLDSSRRTYAFLTAGHFPPLRAINASSSSIIASISSLVIPANRSAGDWSYGGMLSDPSIVDIDACRFLHDTPPFQSALSSSPRTTRFSHSLYPHRRAWIVVHSEQEAPGSQLRQACRRCTCLTTSPFVTVFQTLEHVAASKQLRQS